MKQKRSEISRKRFFVKNAKILWNFIAATVNCSKDLVEFSALIFLSYKLLIEMFDEENFISLSYLLKFLSVCPQYIRSTVRFLHYFFREIFAFSISRKLRIFFAKQIEAQFCEGNAIMKRNGRENFFKCRFSDCF